MSIQEASSKVPLDDDGGQRTGTVWTAIAYILTALLGSGVLSLTWSMAQLGWILGPILILLFSFVTYYTSVLLAECYRSYDPDTGPRNYTYMDAVKATIGGRFRPKICGASQYLNLCGVAIGYIIAASSSMTAIQKTNCLHSKGANSQCKLVSTIPCKTAFGAVQIIVSQIPNFHQIWWLSIVSTVMSMIYSSIGLGLAVAKVIEAGEFRGSVTGISTGTISQAQKIYKSFQAIGSIAFAYSFSVMLLEIQDTIKSPPSGPSEYKTMKKAILLSLSVTTILYMLCGCFGYAALGDLSPENLLIAFGTYNHYWLLDIANTAIVIQHIGAYQVCCQPVFTFIEKTASEWFPNSNFISQEIPITTTNCKLNLFRLVWRTIFVILTTIISMVMPFFNDVVGVFGAIGLWRLTIYFPVAMYIKKKKIRKWTKTWTCLKILSMSGLLISIAAVVGSIAEMVTDIKHKQAKKQY